LRVRHLGSVLVSVIIPTHNSGDHLDECLQSIGYQDYAPVQVIVVDDYSSDNTAAIAKDRGAKLIQMSGNVSKARNCGLAEATGQYVLILDSDQRLERSVISECIGLTSSGVCQAVIIPEESIGSGALISGLAFEKKIISTEKAQEIPRFFDAGAIKMIGGYDETLRFGEDWDLYIRLSVRGSTGRCSAKILHFEEDDLGRFVKKYISYGGYSRRLFKKHGNDAATRFLTPTPSLDRFLHELMSDPLSASSYLFMRIVKAVAFSYGYFFYFRQKS